MLCFSLAEKWMFWRKLRLILIGNMSWERHFVNEQILLDMISISIQWECFPQRVLWGNFILSLSWVPLLPQTFIPWSFLVSWKKVMLNWFELMVGLSSKKLQTSSGSLLVPFFLKKKWKTNILLWINDF